MGAGVNAIRTQTLIREADVVVVRFGDKYRQWNAAFDAGYARLGKPIVTLHDADHVRRSTGGRPRTREQIDARAASEANRATIERRAAFGECNGAAMTAVRRRHSGPGLRRLEATSARCGGC